MDHHDLTGYYTYRSFFNEPNPAPDFNTLRFAEAELFIHVASDGTITGTLAFPADHLASEKGFMDVKGRVTSWQPPTIEINGVGRPGTVTDAFDYIYQGSLAPTYSAASNQQAALVGTVLRAKPHGNAPAGQTASFVAIKRDFLLPREIPGVALIPQARRMLASRSHRLQHALWHTVRALWDELNANPAAVAEIQQRGWWLTRPPFRAGGLDLENGAGEDFLFMHRRMILMINEVYAKAGKPTLTGWSTIPATDTPQTVYKQTTPNTGTFTFAPDESGFMLPPPVRLEAVTDLRDYERDRMLKSAAFFSGVMRQMERLFKSPTFLSTVTLGHLGNMLEFTIHNWMHLRWTSWAYNPENGRLVSRSLYDIDPKWDSPSNDDLGDFYSSHVSPIFWRLHGWIEDRLKDWARVNAARLKANTIGTVPWFEADGQLVKVSDPFSWPSGDVRVMEEVMRIMEAAVPLPALRRGVVGPRTAVQLLADTTFGI
jgi:hypothetical protein